MTVSLFIPSRNSKLWNFCSLSATLLLSCALLACKEQGGTTLPDEADRDPRTGLTPSEAAEVLVRVADREITLGQYAESLLRMDRYERLRYQSEERQKELLDEMIEVELLAQEARRRGLDKNPEVQLHIRQALRDEILADLERSLPGPESFSEREVKEYYDAHRSEFKEPLRHRVQVIRTGSGAVAELALKQLGGKDAQSVSGESWADVAQKYSLDHDNLGPTDKAELRGDLGFVSAPGDARGDNPEIPAEVRAAAFELKNIGDIFAQPVKSEGSYFVVRLEGLSPARDRSLADADRSIRVELRRQKFLTAEKQFEADLRKKYPVSLSARAEQEPKLKAPAPAAQP